MEIVEWGSRWKVMYPNGGAKKFGSKEQAEAYVEALESGVTITPGFRTLIIDTPVVTEVDEAELTENELEDFLDEDEEAENE
tara:strand:- start:1014 stop:1259 length:246 start_codon:yes stop_codon:yes gene_type:complete